MFGHSYTPDLLKYLDFRVAVFISPGQAEGNITFVSEVEPWSGAKQGITKTVISARSSEAEITC
jgi:hypothetical protein